MPTQSSDNNQWALYAHDGVDAHRTLYFKGHIAITWGGELWNK